MDFPEELTSTMPSSSKTMCDTSSKYDDDDIHLEGSFHLNETISNENDHSINDCLSSPNSYQMDDDSTSYFERSVSPIFTSPSCSSSLNSPSCGVRIKQSDQVEDQFNSEINLLSYSYNTVHSVPKHIGRKCKHTDINVNTPTVSLSSILDVTNHISEGHAWGLIFQCLRSIEQLIEQFDASCCSSTNSSCSENDSLEIVKLNTFDELILEYNGNISNKTWTDHDNAKELIVIKNVSSINSIASSIGTLVYRALPFNEKQHSDSIAPHRKTNKVLMETNLDESDEDEEEDMEPDLEPELEDLFWLLTGSVKQDSLSSTVDEGYADDEEPLSSYLKKSCIPLALQKCVQRFHDKLLYLKVASSNLDDKSSSGCCPILVSLYDNQPNEPLDVDQYFRTVVLLMADEHVKLKKFLNQLHCDKPRQLDTVNYKWMNRSKSTTDELDLEKLRILAHTWIKVMSELRFGVHLKRTNRDEPDSRMGPPNSVTNEPFNMLMEQIRQTNKDNLKSWLNDDLRRYTRRERLQHSISLPAMDYRLGINRNIIQEQLKNLKPASVRHIRQLPVQEPSLHERLMNNIKSFDLSSLRRTTTTVKPDIFELYLQEKSNFYQRTPKKGNMNRPKSEMYLNSNCYSTPIGPLRRSIEETEISKSASSLNTCRGSPLRDSPFQPNVQSAVQQSSRFRRFNSLYILKDGSKRKNLANDDSFNTSARSPSILDSSPLKLISSNIASVLGGSKRYKEKRANKKLKNQSENSLSDGSLSFRRASSILIPSSQCCRHGQLAAIQNTGFHSNLKCLQCTNEQYFGEMHSSIGSTVSIDSLAKTTTLLSNSFQHTSHLRHTFSVRRAKYNERDTRNHQTNMYRTTSSFFFDTNKNRNIQANTCSTKSKFTLSSLTSFFSNFNLYSAQSSNNSKVKKE